MSKIKECFCHLCDYFKRWKRIKRCKCENCCPEYEKDNPDIMYSSMYPYELGCFNPTVKDTTKGVIKK